MHLFTATSGCCYGQLLGTHGEIILAHLTPPSSLWDRALSDNTCTGGWHHGRHDEGQK